MGVRGRGQGCHHCFCLVQQDDSEGSSPRLGGFRMRFGKKAINLGLNVLSLRCFGDIKGTCWVGMSQHLDP